MSALDDLKTRIDEAIYQNTQQKITGEVLQDTLEDMVDTMGVSVSQNTLTIGGVDKGELAGQLIENPEWVRVVTDSENKILYGIKTDGKFYFGDACPPQVQEYVQAQIDAIGIDALLATKVDKVIGKSLIDADFASSQLAIENPEFLEVETDQDGRILESLSKFNEKHFTGDVKIDGELKIGIDEKDTSSISVKEINLDGTIVKNIEDEEERIEIVTDADSKVVSYRKSNGTLVENAGIETNSLKLSDDGMTEFQQALKDSGFNPSGTGDWSDYISEDGKKPLCIPMPKGAVMINILSNFNLENLSKKGRAGASEGVNYDIPTEIEFWDMNGNYFKKKVFMSGQGNASMEFPKKNIAFDFFDSEYDGDAFAIKFGDWVAQDSYHLKSYYTDAFRCIGLASYKLYDQMEKTRGVKDDYVFKRALIDFSKIGYVANGYNDLSDLSLQFETGAKCFPDGFPCLVYQNGTFWGLTCWQIKKHRDNYHMKKSKEKNIHLDGTINATTLFNGTIDWTKFEVRNPKNVVYATAHSGTYKYDADEPGQYDIAGDGTLDYPSWETGTYDVDDIVEHNGHIFINTVANNASEPIIDTVNNRNTDSEPDFKNKTGCGWINCTLTVKVKKYVTDLSTRIAEISSASTSSQKKEKIETYFDVDNLIDYLIISDITRNYDGFDKNWQWLTYDGVKWFIGLYDLDGSFGGNFTGTSNILPLDGNHVNTSLMMGYVTTYYSTELNSRYASLRESKILDKDNIIGIVRDILLKFGEQNFEKEFAKWTNCPCNRNSVLNEHWEYVLDANGNPQLGTANYNGSTTYNAGDSCYYAQYPGNGEAAYKYKVKSTSEAVQGIKPVTAFGYRDSIYRLYNWISKNIENLDIVYGFTN